MTAGSERLRLIKLVHTVVWAFFVACILAVPIAATAHRFDIAVPAAAIVLLEVAVLLANGWRCPLTDLAARHTHERQANFDIYLPEWLAQHNKLIFGVAFVLGLGWAGVCWFRPLA